MAEITGEQTIPNKPSSGLSHWMSRLRSYLFWDPLIWGYTIVLGCLSLICSFFDRDGRIQHGFARLWSRMILGTLGCRVEVVGLDKFDNRRGHVYAVNHLSALDIPVLYANLPFQFKILAKKELFRYPFMGWHLRRSGQIPVDLQNNRSSIRSIGKGVDALTAGSAIVIFPEGGRSADGHLQEFMGGAFYLAIKAQVDVVPMAIIGTYETLPMNGFHIQPRPLRLLVGEPIPTTGMNIRQVEALTQRARQVIEDLYYSNAAVPDRRVRSLEENHSKP